MPTHNHNLKHPAPFILDHATLVPQGGIVLDLACGGGRHGRWFLERGHPVVFVDRDVSGVTDLIDRDGAEILEMDLETEAGWPLGGWRFDAIVVVNYLWRPILPAIIAAIAPGGVLLYDTFALGNEVFGKPSNPDFLLKPGELRKAVAGQLAVKEFRDGRVDTPQPAMRQSIAAVRAV